MKKPLEAAWVGPKVAWGRVSGNHQGRATSISQLELRYGSIFTLRDGKVQQRNSGFCQLFYLRESCLSSPCLEARQFSSSSCVLGTFQSTAPVLKLRVMSPSGGKSLHRPFKGNVWDSFSSLSHSQTPLVFTVTSHGDWCFLALVLWARETGVGLGSLVPHLGTSAAKISLPIFNHYM
uniref:Uncharacterized protein n=1 Tax=Rousettus aegyptiacus TaxID=9407 RepID=A0A7J8KB92_ROUAE|nr:hypothetical protein HJG63_007964 [Rousettus aegyptiacus]